ncbi:MarR family winged helix-turn-helix transcriptional regulator [Variovorax dokdonensis]|uniref:MarR family winged helix-turn-helix transcriptional regulator n=1 Tax=Variovorax dokdonensis TaxID=344883 RepID=A0ABT7N868_9BURK|nr:MarR family winged helix-turn-helix transcriptional regulator [Variovorax dokdonensis]MDM0044122.1 MarR family winged helix-turn-helix transcriptional regulator [Variovorax dokdonensis]
MNNPRDASSVPASKAPRTRRAGAAQELRFVEDYLPALLAQASHLISSEFHKVAREQGFSVSEWRVMASLAGGTAISIGRLAQIAVMKQPTVTRLLDRMSTKGHVERLPHESDRRITLVRITDEGERTVGHLMELAREHEHRVLEPFGLPSAEALKDTLRRMIELHERAPDAADDNEPDDLV